MNALKIINGKLVLPDGVVEGKSLYVLDGKIQAITGEMLDFPDLQEMDVHGNYVAPGFIDMHVHGGADHDFMDNDPLGFVAIAQMHAQHGTTSMNPTTLSCGKEDLLETIRLYDAAEPVRYDGAQFIGLHIEGPYFAMEQRGAQDPRFIRDPDPEEYGEVLAAAKHIARWSAAPELPGALEFGKYMVQHKVMPAIAHTNASYEDVVQAFDAGYTHVTHFYSAMSGVFRRNAFRYAGVVESAYLIDEMTVEIIADGVHLPPPLLQLVYKLKGADKIALITDAMRGAGTQGSGSILGSRKNGLPVLLEDGVAKLPDRSAFAGSIATMDRLVRNMITLAGVSLMDAVKMATATPAKLMGVHEWTGSLEEGKQADIVVFDPSVAILKTIIGGRLVHDAGKLELPEAD
ncbi:N-acetylglucosamine-6-phosphate deacetylase [Niabella soli]|uniref:N-acetylglucosamine-6-phosphate deacetylase n=1 Tax=Niabella soli DSM 19437 TaxID=929713 RepID=W0EY88_9BACT|nr:N-acetylglucosamine-6-phosphate deacetylase [Niabella soli]AHF15775.1 N-acetylglucosamine-6-phosphate deacetylase [Niabella soli DSM 19437]